MVAISQDLVEMVSSKEAIESLCKEMDVLRANIADLEVAQATSNQNHAKEVEDVVQRLIKDMALKLEYVNGSPEWNVSKSEDSLRATESKHIAPEKSLNPSQLQDPDNSTSGDVATLGKADYSSTLSICLNPFKIKIPLSLVGQSSNESNVARKRNEILQKSIDTKDRKMSELKNELAQQKKTYELSESRLQESATNQLMAAEIQKLKAEMQQNREDHEKQVEIDSRTIEDLKRQLKEKPMGEEVQALRVKINDLLKRADAMATSNQHLLQEKLELQSQCDYYRESLQKELAKQCRLQRELQLAADVKANFSATSKRLDDLNIELESAKQELKLKEKELSKYKIVSAKRAAKPCLVTNPFRREMLAATTNFETHEDNVWVKDFQDIIREKNEELLKKNELIELLSQMNSEEMKKCSSLKF